MDGPNPNQSDGDFAEMMGRSDEEIDLGAAALMIARQEYPTLNIDRYALRLMRMGNAVRSRLEGSSEPRNMVRAINLVLFQDEGLRANQKDYYDPRNSFLNDVLDRKKGIPITLSIVYMEVARHAGFPIMGVGFPGHFLVKYQGPDQQLIIDPFSKGLVLTKEEVAQRLHLSSGGEVAFREHYLAAATKKQIISRVLTNLKAVYLSTSDYPKAVGVINMLLDISPWALDEVRDRGKVYFQMKAYPQALADLETYLEFNRKAGDAPAIRQNVKHLKTLVSKSK